MSQIQVSPEHDAFLASLNPDRSAALAEVLGLYMAMLRQAKAAELASRANGSLFPDAPGHKTRRPPTGPVADLVGWFSKTAWPHHRGRGSVYEPKKRDFIAAANLLKTHTREDVEYRAENMLAHREQWWVDNASLSLLESRWNNLDMEPNAR